MAAIAIHMELEGGQFQSPPNSKFRSPSKREMARSQELLTRILLPKLMKQERSHALSKRPRIRCAVEADIKIQGVISSTQTAKGRVLDLEEEFQKLEGKVDKLELELEHGQKFHMIHQLSFSPASSELSPPDTPTTGGKRTPPPREAKMRALSSVNGNKTSSNSTMMSPSSPGYLLSSPIMEYSRKKKLVEICLNRLLSNLKGEAEILQGMFEENFKVLKFRRAEACVLGMVKLQRKLKGFEDSVCELRDRLLHINK